MATPLGSIAEEAAPDFTIHDPETGESLTEQLCLDCRSLALGRIMQDVEINPERRQELDIQVSPKSTCPLCHFLGFGLVPSLDPVDSISHTALSDETRYRIDLWCFKKGTYLTQEFYPCAFHCGAWPKYRILLPATENQANIQPEAHTQALRADCVDLELFKTWMTECEQHHGLDCRLATDEAATSWPDSLSGFKVIDCTHNDIVLCPPKAKYVALSYVWGPTEDHAGGTLSSIPTRMAISPPISRLHLPRTIQDAMEVVTKIGLRYLWVDKYCIDQTNPVELRHQISAMDKIYQNATFTVIAAAGADSAYGLPGVRPGSRAPQPRLVINGTRYASVLRWPDEDVYSSVWNKRGWTLQEGYFARRRLIFTEELVIFQCNQICRSELEKLAPVIRADSNTSIYLGRYGKSITPSPLGVEHILSNIEEYSKRELSHESDGLNAIQGILSSYTATHLADLANGMEAARFVHFWGVPITLAPYRGFDASKVEAEAWRMVQKLKTNQQFCLALVLGCSWRGFGAVRRHKFPSWSWAGWTGSCHWPYDSKFSFPESDLSMRIWVHTSSGIPEKLDEHFVSNLIGAQSHDAAPYALRLGLETTLITLKLDTAILQSGTLTLSIDLASLSENFITSLPEGCKSGKLYWEILITPAIHEGDDLHTELRTREFECVVMFGHYGLLLRTRGGVSERIGMIKSLDAEFENAEGQYDLTTRDELSHDVRCLMNYFPTRQEVVLLE
jgi:hypothetical protein